MNNIATVILHRAIRHPDISLKSRYQKLLEAAISAPSRDLLSWFLPEGLGDQRKLFKFNIGI